MLNELIQKFKELFGDQGDIRAYFAPGRVNLIGEHTDYNGGHVFPCALTLGTYAVVRMRKDRTLRFYSENFQQIGVIETSLEDLVPSERAGWTNYPKGVMWAFGRHGYSLTCGMDMAISGDIPAGSGLSSSASLEVLTGLVLKDLYGLEEMDMVQIARIGQYAENRFNGCKCGIMDQFASAMGKRDHGIFLNTNTLQYEYAPVRLKGARIMIVNSKVKHTLVDSQYNNRREECEKALAELQTVTGIQTLGDLTEETFEKYKYAIKDKVRRKRAMHAVYENQRTIQAMEALKQNRIELFGVLMNASHESLKNNYEVSCEEIDILVELAQSMPGVIGARMTGGGFGGCTVNIVKEEVVERFIREIGKDYLKKTGQKAEFYVVDVGEGAHRCR